MWYFRDTPTLVNVFPIQVTKFPNLGHDTVFHKLQRMPYAESRKGS